jgi:glycerol-3-phosphate dehydrogenase
MEERGLKWLDKKKTKYKKGVAKITLPERLVPDESIDTLQEYDILLIAIPKKKVSKFCEVQV